MTKSHSALTPAAVSLILLSFILGTSEFIIVGILPEIAEGIGCSITMAGSLISIFAFSYALGTPFATALLSSLNRYRTLLGLTAVFIAGNALCAIAPDYAFLAAARIVTAVVSGVMISISMTFTVDIASPENQSKVISWIFSGFSIASIFGVPLGTVISQAAGWRTSFVVLSVFSVLILLMMYRVLPDTGRGRKSNLLDQFTIVKNKRISLCMMTAICGAAGSYVFYTYMTPFLHEYLNIPVSYTSMMLSLFGIGTIISNLASGRIAGMGGMKKMPLVYLIQAAALFFLLFSPHIQAVGIANFIAIGILMYLQNAPVQLHFLRTAKREQPSALSFASSLNPVSFNLGITIGSGIGSLIVGSFSMIYIGLGGAVLTLLAMFFNIVLLKNMANIRRRPHLIKKSS